MSSRVDSAVTPAAVATPGGLRLGPYAPWLLTYLIANIVAAVIILRSDYMIADASEVRTGAAIDIYIATALTLASYVLVAWVLFDFMTRLRVRLQSRRLDSRDGRREATFVGGFLLLLQLAFLAFNLAEGINVAGATNVKTDSPLNLLFVLLQPDILFFVYYGYFRETPQFKYNLAVYVVSNLLRGWSGFLLTIAFFEWCRAYRRGQLRMGLVFICGLGVLLAYPVLLAFKWFVRFNGPGAFLDFSRLVTSIGASLSAEDYGTLLAAGIQHLIDRLQSVSLVAAVAQSRVTLENMLLAGQIAPYWWEGLPQLGLTHIFGLDKAPTLGAAITEVFAFRVGIEMGSWSIPPGLAGWVLLDPLRSVYFAGYVALVCFISVLLAPGCQRPGATRDLLWYAWLVYLIPGWLTAFNGVICALVVLHALRAFGRKLPRLRLGRRAASWPLNSERGP